MIKKINLTDWSGNEIRRGLVEMHNKRADEAEKLEREIQTQKSPDKLEALRQALKNIEDEAERIAEMLSELEKPAKDQPEGMNEGRSLIMGMMGGAQIEERGNNSPEGVSFRSVASWNSNKKEKEGNKPMENIRSDFYKQFVENRAAGDTSSMSAVIPDTVIANYAVERAPGAFYNAASKTSIAHGGTLSVPYAALQTIGEHAENAEIENAGYVPPTVQVVHKEYSYNSGYSRIGVAVGVASFMQIIEQTALQSMFKTFDRVCMNAVAALIYGETNSVEYTKGGAPVFADFVKAAGKLGADYVDGAKWYMSPATYFNLVMTLTDTAGNLIFDATKRVEDNAMLGYGFETDSQLPAGVIYFGNASRIHFNAAQPAELTRWTDYRTSTEMASVSASVGAACEPGAFVRLSEASA